MRKLVNLILKVIFFIPNLLADATLGVADFVDRAKLFPKIFYGYFISLVAGAFMIYPLTACVGLIDFVFNLNMADGFLNFFLEKYKFIKLPLLGSVAYLWVLREVIFK
tara:strand:- start:24 stop:347 length:324 start_codon:yes stop_codon:yes gene_type:complete